MSRAIQVVVVVAVLLSVLLELRLESSYLKEYVSMESTVFFVSNATAAFGVSSDRFQDSTLGSGRQSPSWNDSSSAVSPKDPSVIAKDVSIIITSSLTPLHPSLIYINRTIRSLHWLHGLPTNTPIYVTIDGLPVKSATFDNINRLQQYTDLLQKSEFPPYTNITVLPSKVHLHIAGSVQMALEHVQTTFVYVLQHDLVFKKPVEHDKLLKAMTDHPDKLRNIRFRFRHGHGGAPNGEWPLCNNQTDDWTLNGLKFFPTATWSDNNQLSTKAYYEEMFGIMKVLRQPMEWTMIYPARANCTFWGQTLYGERYAGGNFIYHLRARTRTPSND